MSTLDKFFDKALVTSESTVDDSPYSRRLLPCLRANSDFGIRNALSELLLHPHVRSFRTRAALGQSNQPHIFHVLETFSLNQQGEGIQNVIGIYLLHGPRLQQRAQTEDLVYIGQSLAMKADSQKGLGIRLRSTQRWQSIAKCQAALRQHANLPARSDVMWAHQRLASTEFGETRLVVLSVFSFPRADMGSAIFHYAYLLTLAETLDVLFLASYQPKSSITSDLCRNRNCLAMRSQIPHSAFEGLDRELLSRQEIRRYAPILSIHRSPDEIHTFIDVVQQNESAVYHHMTRNPGI
jgi:hypothetical protein